MVLVVAVDVLACVSSDRGQCHMHSLPVQCFAAGAVAGGHKKDHSYQLIVRHTLFTPNSASVDQELGQGARVGPDWAIVVVAV